MNWYKNKVIWITGASSGIGEALCIELAKAGAKIILSSRRSEELNRVKHEMHLPEDDFLILPLDLENTLNVDVSVKQVIAKFGRIDILINNGGISQRSLTQDTPIEIDRKIMEINFFGTVALTKAVLPYLLKQKSGNIVVVSSIAGKFGFYFRSTYSASKHALHGFFESLRMEIFNHNVKVLIVCPGKINTKISINAIKYDGSNHNKMDLSQANGMSAEECARKIICAIENHKEEIFIGGKELRSIWVKRFFPNFFSKQIRKQKQE